MPSDLESRFKASLQCLTAAGMPFEIGTIEHNGRNHRAFSRAPATLPELFELYCAEYGEAEFLVDHDVRLTFAETLETARRLASGLITRHGLRPGDRVGIAARNSVNWVIGYMGTVMAGGCAALLNGWWSSEELAGGVALAGCSMVLADPVRAARLGELPTPPRTVVFDHGPPVTGLAALLDEPIELPVLGPGDPATLVYTSGSTGLAKAALSDHRALTQVTMAFAVHALAIDAIPTSIGNNPPLQRTALATVPLFHVTGEVALMLASLPLGRRLVLMPRWDAREAMELIERERVTTLVGVPLMALEIATHPLRPSYDLSSCTIFAAGGAARPADHLPRLEAALPHARHVMGYGLTETNCLGACDVLASSAARQGSSGPPSSDIVEIAVLGPEGMPLPAAVRGEIAVRSICNFREYWGNPEETAAAVRPDGFFLTGDIGYQDADGHLYVVDRKKDIIVRGGENIASAEVEQAIYSHPHVAEATVFGLPDDRYGEVPVAVYAIKDGHRLSEEELRKHLAPLIAHFKLPVRLWREDAALPRLGTQKIDKRSLKARYSQGWEAAKTAR